MHPEVEDFLRKEQAVMLPLDPTTREAVWEAEQEVTIPLYTNYAQDYCGPVKDEYVACMKNKENRNKTAAPRKNAKDGSSLEEEEPCQREIYRAQGCGNLVAFSIVMACSEESLAKAREKLPNSRAYRDELETSLPYCAWKHASKKVFPDPIVPNGADESIPSALDVYVKEEGKSRFEDLTSILVDGKKNVDERNFWQKWF